MEPRARAGKNVGKMNFNHNELAQLLYGHGDLKTPLPETVRVLDELITDFIQGVGFEATRAAHHAGRQKVKFEDFEFAMRRNPRFMGKIQEVFEKKKEIEAARKNFNIEDQLMKDADKEEKEKEKKGGDKGDKGGKEGGDKGVRDKAGGDKEKGPGSSVSGSMGTKRKRQQQGDMLEDEELDELDDDLEAEADIGTAAKRR
ncbi:transcription initiation factor IID, 18kD subunit-domain-containing protein [Pseudoneurospora amorphoporcata]|uniref:Transcription initiation factor TFIID subunit 13 n=1 Tax=Pseudoneurospora amorphoporcata TaxID=241081 RepID=A0AAN6P5J1_9PEZI|nr:transcription initiation factor IID, 18kD subunit-domain-containing protein [Pseudoneurospora amorphoporcata]